MLNPYFFPTALALVLSAGLPDAGPPKPLAVDNRKLFDDYGSNELAADRKYRGQILEVTSILDRVEVDETGGIVFYLTSRNPFSFTYAALETEAAKKDDRIEKLTRGDKVVVTCVCVGRKVGMPLLGGCVLKKAFRRGD